MSIQIMVCSPLNYYSDGMDCDNPAELTRIFNRRIKEYFNIVFSETDNRLVLSEDLSPSAGVDIIMLAYDFSKDIHKHLTAELFLPGFFNGSQLNLPKIGEKAIVDSTANFKQAIDQIEPVLKKKFKDFAKYQAELDAYRMAIKVSEKENMPIFWSY